METIKISTRLTFSWAVEVLWIQFLVRLASFPSLAVGKKHDAKSRVGIFLFTSKQAYNEINDSES